jgi:hypothetical protein
MLKWMFRKKLRDFERKHDYDASYLHEVLATDERAFVQFGLAVNIGAYKKDVPADVYFAAQLTSSMHADCGPCTQLVVEYALEEGVAPETIAAIVAGNEAALTPDVVLAVRFARALLARDLEVDACRDEIERRWGPRAVLSIAFGVMTSQMFPTLKYALGHGKACTRVLVAGKTVSRPALAASVS